MGGIKTILNWVAWGVMIACIVGFIVGIGVLVLGEHSPETRGGKKIIVALIGMALLGAIAGIFGAVTGG